MRKYQQLFLLLLSCLSVTVLIIYKSENDKLKYVLNLMNFFARNDAIILRQIQNSTGYLHFMHPGAPVWQNLDGSFYAYASYWNQNELISGGEALTIVAGHTGEVVNFRCELTYNGGARVIKGKFHFQRAYKDFQEHESDFTSYNFFCRILRNFGDPDSVSYFRINTASDKWAPKLHLRKIKSIPATISPMTICVNMVTFNSSSAFNKKDSNIIQFFLHHKALGIDDFIIYNGNELGENILRSPHMNSLKLNLFPFNFPFNPQNATERLQRFMTMDCILRNINKSKYTILLAVNEFFYPSAKLFDNQSLLESLRNYSYEYTDFTISTFPVCIDPSNEFLMDNSYYDSEIPPKYLTIYRPHVPFSMMTQNTTKNVILPISKGFGHKYIECHHIGKDGLHDWRNSLRTPSMQFIQTIRSDLKAWLSTT